MEQLQTVKHPQFGQLSIIVIDGKEMFKAKECALMLGYKDTTNAIKQHCKGVVKHHLPTKSGKQTVNLIPEGDVWRLIIRSKLPQAVEVEKWIMDDVLPSIRKTGKYLMRTESEPIQLQLYDYFDKTYKGEPVLTVADVAYITGLSSSIISWYTRTKLTINFDFYNLSKGELVKFKQENPKISRFSSGLCIITKSGFELICKAYGIKIETPKVFIEEKKVSKPKTEYAVVRNNPYIQNTIEKIRKQLTAVDVLLTNYNRHNVEIDDMNSLRKTLANLGLELGSEISGLAREKISVTTEYKV